jgi:hypothetical protein
MKRLLSVVMSLAVVAACSDADPLRPNGPPEPGEPLQAAAGPATARDVSAVLVFDYLVRPADERLTGAVLHRTGEEVVWTVDGDLTGAFHATADFLFHGEVGRGRGSWFMELTAPCVGTISGNWHGVWDPSFQGEMVGRGEDGCQGVLLAGGFAPVTTGNNFVQLFTGTLREANAAIR